MRMAVAGIGGVSVHGPDGVLVGALGVLGMSLTAPTPDALAAADRQQLAHQ